MTTDLVSGRRIVVRDGSLAEALRASATVPLLFSAVKRDTLQLIDAQGAALRALGMATSAARFAHGACHPLPGERLMVDSYHCSRYNTQTRRLTPAMFAEAVACAREWLDR